MSARVVSVRLTDGVAPDLEPTSSRALSGPASLAFSASVTSEASNMTCCHPESAGTPRGPPGPARRARWPCAPTSLRRPGSGCPRAPR
eukprot:2008036-Pyramimonas_sp.AAC.1